MKLHFHRDLIDVHYQTPVNLVNFLEKCKDFEVAFMVYLQTFNALT